MNHLRFRILSFAGISLASMAFTRVSSVEKIDVVVIDAGHGGKDPGTSGEKVSEKSIVLGIALKVGAYIEEKLPDIKVIYTRKDDRFISLDKRAEAANKNKADLFISIHANSSPNPLVSGTETYVMGPNKTEENLEVAKRENSVILLDEKYKERYEGFDPNSPESYILFSLTQGAFRESSLRMAYSLEKKYNSKAGRKSRGVKQSGFLVLWRTGMPSILTEVGYLTNKEEEKFLNTENGQASIASAIGHAIEDYKRQVELINH